MNENFEDTLIVTYRLQQDESGATKVRLRNPLNVVCTLIDNDMRHRITVVKMLWIHEA